MLSSDFELDFSGCRTIFGKFPGLSQASCDALTNSLRESMGQPLQGAGISFQPLEVSYGDGMAYQLLAYEEYSKISAYNLCEHLKKIIPGLSYGSTTVFFRKDHLQQLCTALKGNQIKPLNTTNEINISEPDTVATLFTSVSNDGQSFDISSAIKEIMKSTFNIDNDILSVVKNDDNYVISCINVTTEETPHMEAMKSFFKNQMKIGSQKKFHLEDIEHNYKVYFRLPEDKTADLFNKLSAVESDLACSSETLQERGLSL